MSPDGDLETMFVDNYAMIDQYAMTGSLWTWGYNLNGQLGDNTNAHKSSPIQTISGGTNWKQVSAGGANAAAIKTDGTLWLWGANQFGTLGDGTILAKSSPVQTISGGTNGKQVSVSNTGGTIGYTVGAIKTDGTLWTWGSGAQGILGDNTSATKSSPVQTIATGTNWKQVSTGYRNMAAIKTDGTLWLWGDGTRGQLGDNTSATKSSPVQTISTGTNWKQVSSGAAMTGAIKTDGTLWTWGNNYYGQLGDNSSVNKSSPVQTISGGTNWKQISVNHTGSAAAIKTDGTLWTWGEGILGQLGDNTTISKSSPVQTISGGTNWKQVSTGRAVGAIKTDGTLWTWGTGSYGQLGNNVNGSGGQDVRTSPVQTVAGGTNWKEVSANTIYMCAIYFYDAGNLYPSK